MDEEDGRSAREGIQIPEKAMKALIYSHEHQSLLCQNIFLFKRVYFG